MHIAYAITDYICNALRITLKVLEHSNVFDFTVSLCHMNRPMAFSLRSHVTLIRLRNINKAVKIKSQHQRKKLRKTNPMEMSQLFAKCLTSLSKGI